MTEENAELRGIIGSGDYKILPNNEYDNLLYSMPMNERFSDVRLNKVGINSVIKSGTIYIKQGCL